MEYDKNLLQLTEMVLTAIKRHASPITHRSNYNLAVKTLDMVLARKKKEGKLDHSIEYYAQHVAKSMVNVDYHKLLKAYMKRKPVTEDTMNFKEFQDYLEEALIVLGGRSNPKFNNVVIMAGGAGSGKGFVLNNLIGVDGFKFDVDALKSSVMRTPKLVDQIKKEFGVDVSVEKFPLTNPKNVEKLHAIIKSSLHLDDKKLTTFYASVLSTHPERKPNVIFDVTLKSLNKLQKLSDMVSLLGYPKENIHIVWVVNDIEIALKQNKDPSRGRIVPPEILVNTHRGVSATMHDIVSMGERLKQYMDGDIVLAFNKIGVDSEYVKSGKGGGYIKKANYVYIKRAGNDIMPEDQVRKELGSKIASYVPKGVSWV